MQMLREESHSFTDWHISDWQFAASREEKRERNVDGILEEDNNKEKKFNGQKYLYKGSSSCVIYYLE